MNNINDITKGAERMIEQALKLQEDMIKYSQSFDTEGVLDDLYKDLNTAKNNMDWEAANNVTKKMQDRFNELNKKEQDAD